MKTKKKQKMPVGYRGEEWQRYAAAVLASVSMGDDGPDDGALSLSDATIDRTVEIAARYADALVAERKRLDAEE